MAYRKQEEISQQDLYESVKTLVETEASVIHLNQHKLYTLVSIAFQYLLFRSTKIPGAYIIRIEDNFLTNKLIRKAKDKSTRSFLQSLSLPRRFKYGKSVFYLDFFNVATWNMTKDLDPDRIKGSMIVKNSTQAPMIEIDEENKEQFDLPPNYFLDTLRDVADKTLIIAYEHTFDNVEVVRFPFIKDKTPETLKGVKVSGIDINSLE